MATPGYRAQLYTTGAALQVNGEAMTQVSGTTYEISNSAFNIWNWDQEPTVYDDGTPVSVDKVFYLSGRVELASAPAGAVTVDTEYLPKAAFAEGRSVDFQRTSEELDVTVFGDTDVQRIYGLQDMEATIEGFQTFLDPVDTGEDSLSDTLEGRDYLVLSYKPDENLDYTMKAVVMFGTQELSQSVDSLMESTITMMGAAPKSTFGDQVIFERNTQ